MLVCDSTTLYDNSYVASRSMDYASYSKIHKVCRPCATQMGSFYCFRAAPKRASPLRAQRIYIVGRRGDRKVSIANTDTL